MALTELAVKNLKPKEKRYMVRDDQGLYLEVMPTGAKIWRLRCWEHGKEFKVTLGEYPLISLRDARLKRDGVRVDRAQGISPRTPPQKAMSFEAVAVEWHEKQILPKTPKYAHKILSILRRYVFPAVGAVSIRELTAPEILACVRAIENRGLNDTARTALQVVGQIFRYAIASGYASHNPAGDLRGALAAVVRKHNASLTDPVKIAGLLKAMQAFTGSEVVRCALWFSAYVFCRPGEIRRAEWTEVNFEAREWRIPAEKMKMRRQHIVPLSDQAYDILERLRPLTGHGKYIFPSIRTAATGSVPMSENTIAAALRRLGFAQDEMSAHGFRSMASTILHEQGWPSDAIERQLAHVEGNAVKAAYNHAEYLPERRKMMQAWSDWLDSLIE